MRAPATLAVRLERYLAERRRLGFQLRTMSYSLHSLVDHVSKTGHCGALTIEVMATWARQARQVAGTHVTWSRRLRRLRPFTRWLSTYLGHVKISSTYWYFTAVPQLMAIAGRRFEHFADPGQDLGEDGDA